MAKSIQAYADWYHRRLGAKVVLGDLTTAHMHLLVNMTNGQCGDILLTPRVAEILVDAIVPGSFNYGPVGRLLA